MNIQATLSHLPENKVFDKNRFRKAVRTVDPECSEAMVNWMLVTLRKKSILAKAGTGRYYLLSHDAPSKKTYHYPHSQEYMEIEKHIVTSYPLVNFQMWELIQMNDFVNHQIAKNMIIVEVESMLVDTIYDKVHEKYPYAMVSPDINSFYKQRAPETDIIVQKLISESPSPASGHSSPIEKLLVDLLSKKLSGQLIERSEYPRIFEDVFHKYIIDETKMFRYAKRRHLYDTLLSFIDKHTDIKLMTV